MARKIVNEVLVKMRMDNTDLKTAARDAQASLESVSKSVGSLDAAVFGLNRTIRVWVIDKMGRELVNVSKGLGSFFKDAAVSAAEYDKVLADVSFASGQNLSITRQIGEEYRKFASGLPFAAKGIAEIAETLSRQGLIHGYEQMVKVPELIMQTAEAMNIKNVKEFGEAVGSIGLNFGLTADEMKRYLNMTTRVEMATKATVSDLAIGGMRASALAALNKVSPAMMSTMIGVGSRAGFDPKTLGSLTSDFIRRVTDPYTGHIATGYSAGRIKEILKGGPGSADILMQAFIEKGSKLPTYKIGEFLQSLGMRMNKQSIAAAATLFKNKGEFNEVYGGAAGEWEHPGIVQAKQALNLETTEKQLEAIDKDASSIKQSIGQGVLNIVATPIAGVNQLMSKLNKLLIDHPVLKDVLAFAIGAGSILTGVSGLSLLAISVVTIMKMAMGFIKNLTGIQNLSLMSFARHPFLGARIAYGIASGRYEKQGQFVPTANLLELAALRAMGGTGGGAGAGSGSAGASGIVGGFMGGMLGETTDPFGIAGSQLSVIPTHLNLKRRLYNYYSQRSYGYGPNKSGLIRGPFNLIRTLESQGKYVEANRLRRIFVTGYPGGQDNRDFFERMRIGAMMSHPAYAASFRKAYVDPAIPSSNDFPPGFGSSSSLLSDPNNYDYRTSERPGAMRRLGRWIGGKAGASEGSSFFGIPALIGGGITGSLINFSSKLLTALAPSILSLITSPFFLFGLASAGYLYMEDIHAKANARGGYEPFAREVRNRGIVAKDTRGSFSKMFSGISEYLTVNDILTSGEMKRDVDDYLEQVYNKDNKTHFKLLPLAGTKDYVSLLSDKLPGGKRLQQINKDFALQYNEGEDVKKVLKVLDPALKKFNEDIEAVQLKNRPDLDPEKYGRNPATGVIEVKNNVKVNLNNKQIGRAISDDIHEQNINSGISAPGFIGG